MNWGLGWVGKAGGKGGSPGLRRDLAAPGDLGRDTDYSSGELVTSRPEIPTFGHVFTYF